MHIFDRLSIGIILLDSAGCVLSANASARGLMRNGRRLGLHTSIFEAFPAGLPRLRERVAGAQAPSAIELSISPTVEGSPLMILAADLRATEAAQLSRAFQRTATVLFLCDPTRPVELPIAWMMDAYGLTLAEARTAIAASSGMTVAGMARQLGLSPNTIKTHLRRIFAKTNTGRQPELARLVASLAVLRAG